MMDCISSGWPIHNLRGRNLGEKPLVCVIQRFLGDHRAQGPIEGLGPVFLGCAGTERRYPYKFPK